MKYRPEIDGLRALAVVPVIFYHAGYFTVSGGFVGVDVFFVISGYLITSILVRDMEADRFSIRDFYARRARRLMPALLTVCLASAVAAALLMPPEALADFGRSLLATLLFVSNILFWSESGYFAAASDFKPLLHTWSLAIEEQFYLFFPLVLLLARRLDRRQLVLLLSAAWLASFILAGWASQRYAEANFYLLPSRTFELMTGALIALVPGLTPASAKWRTLGAAAGVLAILVAVALYTPRTPFPGPFALLPVLGSALVIVCARNTEPMGRILGWRGFTLVGKISYSAYLWHWPLFVFAKLWAFQGGPQPNYPFLIALTGLLSWLSWKYVETPFRSPERIPARTALVTFGAATSAAAAIGLAVMLAPSAFDRTHAPQFAAHQATATYSPYRDTCHTRGRNYRAPADACTYPGESPSWAVFGDSHTVEFGAALSDALGARGESLSHHSFSNCQPMAGRTSANRNGCGSWTEDTLAYLSGHDEIETVVVAYRLNGYLWGDHAALYPRHPRDFDDAVRDAVWASYLEALRRLSGSGKTVVALVQVPEIPAPVDYMMRRPVTAEGVIEGVPRLWWDERQAWVMARSDEIPEGVILVDTTDLFCDDRVCRAAEGDTFLYFDQNHLSPAGQARVADAVIEAVETAWAVPISGEVH